MSQPLPQAGLWRFGGLSPLELLRRLWRGYQDYQISAFSAQFAFYAMLALAPTLILVIASASLLPLDGLLAGLANVLGGVMPKGSYDVLENQVREVYTNSTGSVILPCVVVLLFAGWRLFQGLGQGLNAIDGTASSKQRLRTGGISFLLTLAIIPVLLLSLALTVAGPMLTAAVLNALEMAGIERYLVHVLRWLIVLACLLFCTSMLYFLLPAAKLRWHWISPGSLLAVFGWMIASWGFRIYVEHFGRYNETYGTLGGVIVLLLWLHLIGSFLLLGGLLNGVIYRAGVEE